MGQGREFFKVKILPSGGFMGTGTLNTLEKLLKALLNVGGYFPRSEISFLPPTLPPGVGANFHYN